MKIVDLSLPLYTGMPVYPGDPEASIELFQTVAQNGWDTRRLQINSHDGTHVNVPAHGVQGGKNLDAYALEDFCGRARIYDLLKPIFPNEGIIFRDQNITKEIAEKIKFVRPKFVGLSDRFEFDEEIEKDLLRAGIISFERLTNLDKLPEIFDFYGLPLKIKDGDGSPVRAFAIIQP